MGAFNVWGLVHADGTVVWTLDTWSVGFFDGWTVHLPLGLYLLLRYGRATRPAGPFGLGLVWHTAPLASAGPPRRAGFARPLWMALPPGLAAYAWLSWALFARGALELATLYGPLAVWVSPGKAWLAVIMLVLLVMRPHAGRREPAADTSRLH